MITRHLMIAAMALVLAVGCGGKQQAAPPEANPAAPAAPEGITPPPAQPAPDLTKIAMDLKAKTVTMEGYFCLKEGILDYFAVVAGGHEYESVVALNAKPSVLHAYLLAMGAVTGPTDAILEEFKKNPPEGKKVPERAGSKFSVTVEWKDADGKAVSVPGGQLIINRKTGKPADIVIWFFTGSFFAPDPDTKKQLYMADLDQCIIANYHTPSAVLNISADIGNPYDANDTGYELNKALVPKLGTPCKVILKMLDEPAK